MINKNLNTKKGITLVALVITIVILIILAGVSLTLILGNNGILSKAKEGRENYTQAQKAEISVLSDMPDEIDDYVEGPMPIKMIVNSGSDGLVILPIDDTTPCTIDWGDGNTTTKTAEVNEETQLASLGKIKLASTKVNGFYHTYATLNKEYEVSISGNVTSIKSLFYYNNGTTQVYCDNATQKIMEITDWGTTGLNSIGLDGCTNLRKIASPRKKSFANVTSFDSTFYYCTSLTSIPENLFANCPNVTSFRGTFERCSSITSISENLFANCQNVESFEDTFGGCSSLTSIPENLFASCPNVTNFVGTFDGCSGITSIPENLFASCPNVTDFGSTFCGCSGITSIPENLFASCPNVTNFSNTFSCCSKLTGQAPNLWTKGTNTEANEYKGSPNGHGCYYNCTSLTNYSSIPSYWTENDQPQF